MEEPGDDRSSVPATKGDDYFSAPFDPKLRSWLALVEGAHAGEATHAFYRAGRYKDALGDCKYTLARFPNHPKALYLIGRIAQDIKQPTMAIPYYEAALKYYPQYAYTHAQYGRYLVEIGATAAGLAELREAMRMDPDELQARAWYAEAQAEATAPGQGSASGDSTAVGPVKPSDDRTRKSAKN